MNTQYRVWDKVQKQYFNAGFVISPDGHPLKLRTIAEQDYTGWHRNGDLILEQAVGLKDKNGKEIYENDVVLWNGRKATIEWLPRMAGWFAMNEGSGVHFHEQQEIVMPHHGLKHIEIIGNIHENPELLR